VSPTRLSNRERHLRNELLELIANVPSVKQKVSKREVRILHRPQRLNQLKKLNGSFSDLAMALKKNLAKPREVRPREIDPRLICVEANSQEALIFKAATLCWSVPVSEGFGRRMRFIIKDNSNQKLIGVIGLTDPVFNMGPRDKWVGWTSDMRKDKLVNVMDAFVLGALPPYNQLLGGKLVALLACSREVVRQFKMKYGDYRGVISKRKKNARLVLITTTSALGRSSVYNRLKIPGSIQFMTDVEPERVPIWYTKGYGHFHIPNDIFKEMVDMLDRRKHPYAKGNRFGNGPNWKIRVIRQAANNLGLDEDLLVHGIRRQVYIVPLAKNTRSFLLGESINPRYMTLSTKEITEYWRERWGMPRSKRCPDWREWQPNALIRNLKYLQSQASSVKP
jgi:hypothetical protein